MLTGLINVTNGDAQIFGYSLKNDLINIQEIIGVCPQQNVLFPDMTVKEHLVFFARLKGISRSNVDSVVDSIIKEVGLTEKIDSKSSTLSGGQKRKLCVGIAFIGDPKVVFLDEPTSGMRILNYLKELTDVILGMDVNSRRSTWDMIKNFKKGRVIVLTTHFMDEADLLGDRIGIMSKGKLVCCGTSLFLKSKYGVGYSLVITRNDNDEEHKIKILETVKSHLDKFDVINDIGGELFFRVGIASSHLFPALFKAFDEHKSNLGIDSYGVSVTTLEEVFLKIGHNEAVTNAEKEANAELSRTLSEKKLQSTEPKDEKNVNSSEINDIMKKSGDVEKTCAFFQNVCSICE
jgi:ATP-binding cassette subfamily A (ABC1) protein 3